MLQTWVFPRHAVAMTLNLSISAQFTRPLHLPARRPVPVFSSPFATTLFTSVGIVENAPLPASWPSILTVLTSSSEAVSSRPSTAAQCLWDQAPTHQWGTRVFRDLSPETHLNSGLAISPAAPSHGSALPTPAAGRGPGGRAPTSRAHSPWA